CAVTSTTSVSFCQASAPDRTRGSDPGQAPRCLAAATSARFPPTRRGPSAAAAHRGFAAAARPDAVDVEVARSDHEVDVDGAAVAARLLELLVGHGIGAREREL